MKCTVHVYREMKLLFPGIKAETQRDAALIAMGKPTAEAVPTDDCDG